MSIAFLLLLLSLGAAGVCGWQAREQYRQWLAADGIGKALRRARITEAEVQRFLAERNRLLAGQTLAGASVEGVTTVVQTAHRGIAAIPFGILEAIPATRDASRVVRATHDAISGVVYGSIKGVNRGIGLVGQALLKASAAEPKKVLPPPLPALEHEPAPDALPPPEKPK